MANYREGKVTKGIFDAAKLLFENGASNVEVGKYLKISKDVVLYIKKSETYEDYKALMYEKSLAWRKKRAIEAKKAEETKPEETKPVTPEETPVQIVERRQTVTVQATWQMTQEMQKTNKLLEQISNKLAFIVEELTGKTGVDE